MFGNFISEPSLGTSLYCLLGYIIIFSILYSKILSKPISYRHTPLFRKACYFIILIFILTHVMQGDFFQYLKIVKEYDFTIGAQNYGEDIYRVIIKFVNRNYFLFRLVVWGGAYYLFYCTANRLDIEPLYAIAFLFATHVITFAYARATLAMSIYFYGLSFLCKPKAGSIFVSYLWGVFLIFISSKFHNSAMIMMAMTIMLFVPIRKWSFIMVLCLIPLFSYVLKDYFYLMTLTLDSDSVLSAKVKGYSEGDFQIGISGYILNLFEYASFLLPFIICILKTFNKNIIRRVPKSLLRLLKVTTGLVLLAIVFYSFGTSFRTFFYRVLFMTMIPLAIIVPSLYKLNIITYKNYRICLISGVMFCITRYLYEFYALTTVM